MHIPYIFPSSLYIPYSMGSASELLGVSRPSKSWIHSASFWMVGSCTFFSPLPGRSIWACPLWAYCSRFWSRVVGFPLPEAGLPSKSSNSSCWIYDESPSKKRWFCEPLKLDHPKLKWNSQVSWDQGSQDWKLWCCRKAADFLLFFACWSIEVVSIPGDQVWSSPQEKAHGEWGRNLD